MARSLFVVVLVITSVVSAHACTCGQPRPEPCRLMKEASAIFLGAVVDIENPSNPEPKVGDTGLSRYRFRVDERFTAIKAGDIDVYSGRGGADCSYHFRLGVEYLVFAYKGEDGRLSTSICSGTRHAEQAQLLLKTLRAARDGQKVPSLFGVLRREQAGNLSTEIEGYDTPLVNTVVRLTSQTNDQFSTVTDETGAYSFYGLPAGNYRISADVSSHLKMGEGPLDLPAHACYEHDLSTVPAGGIQGRIVGPDGHTIAAAVELFRADRYSARMGWWEYSDGDKGFQFNGVAPGDYLLVFNNDNDVDPDAPFPRTFYPSAPDLVRAQPIHMEEKSGIITADIHVSNQRETRKLMVRLIWQGTKKPDDIIVSAHGNEGREPFPQKISPELYQLTLLKSVRYEIHASQDCGRRETENASIPIGQILSSSVVVESDNPATEVTLVFPDAPCTPYNIPKSSAPNPR